MPRPVVTLREKLVLHESKVKELYAARSKDIISIFKNCNAFTIDDNLLTGFLMFAMDNINKDDHILKDFVELAGSNKNTTKNKRISKK